MSIEQLLKKRYKVIAPKGYHYPNSPFLAGEILEQQQEGVWIVRTNGGVNSFYDRRPENYPHLFKELEWWEDRKPEDMPGYVQAIPPIGGIFKVDKFVLHDGMPRVFCNNLTRRFTIGQVLPSTESEYLSFNQQIKIK